MLPDATTVLLAKDRDSLHALAVRWFADSLALPRALWVQPGDLGDRFGVIGDTGGPLPAPGSFDDAAAWSPICQAWPCQMLPAPEALRQWISAQGYGGVVLAQLAGRRGETGALIGFLDDAWSGSAPDRSPEALVARAEQCAVIVGIAVDRVHDADALEREATLQRLVALADEDHPLDALLKRALDIVLQHRDVHLERRGALFVRERTGALRLVAHVGEEHDPPLGDEPDHGHVVLPLRSRSDVEGVLTLYTAPGVSLPLPTQTNLEFVANAIGQLIERGRLRAKVAEQARAFRALLDHAPIGAAVHNNGRFVYANDMMGRVLGFGTSAEIVGRDVLTFVHDEDRAFVREREARRASSGDPSALAEVRVVSPSGDTLYIETSSVPVVFDGEPSTFVMAQDITERRAAQARAALEERLASIGQLAAMIGHDINNPLTYVRSNLEFALSAVDASPDATREALDDALKGAEFIGQITSDLRAFVHDPHGPSHQTTRLAEVVTFVTRMTSARFRSAVTIVSRVPDDITVRGGPTPLAQIVTSVLLNAAQAVAGSTNTRVDVRAHTSGALAVLEVEHWGPGLSPSQRAQAFEAAATKTERDGLSLYLTRLIAQELHGTLELHSSVGAGTVARVTLPLAAATVVEPELAVATATAERFRVLLIDDDELVLRSMYRMLKAHMDVDMVTGGAAGLERLAATRYDLVLSDMMMPGISGADLYAALAARGDLHATQALVFVTGGVFTPEVAAFLAVNPCPVWFKPVDVDTVLRELQRRRLPPVPSTEIPP